MLNKQLNNLIKEVLKSFIIGSSFPSFIIFFIAVTYFFVREKTAIFNYYRYSMTAPLGLGLAAVLSKTISLKFNIKLKITYFIVSIISASLKCIEISKEEDVYDFKTKERWYLQYLIVFIGHLFVYNFIMYPLDSYL